VANPVTVEDGRILLDRAPGIGIELDWDAVNYHSIGTKSSAA
jgi:L-alanine-DL-glutamate epimerase-like enolase superfamily enzyme